MTGTATIVLPQATWSIISGGKLDQNYHLIHKSSGDDGWYWQDTGGGDMHFHSYWGDDESLAATTGGTSCIWMIDRAIDISNYNYIKARCDKAMNGRTGFCIGISNKNTCTSWSQTSRYAEAPTYTEMTNRNSDVMLDFSDFSKGSYYFYIGHWGYINFDLFSLTFYRNKP